MDATDRGRSNTAHRNNDRKRSSIQSKRRSTRVMSYVALATYGLMAAAAVGYGGENNNDVSTDASLAHHLELKGDETSHRQSVEKGRILKRQTFLQQESSLLEDLKTRLSINIASQKTKKTSASIPKKESSNMMNVLRMKRNSTTRGGGGGGSGTKKMTRGGGNGNKTKKTSRGGSNNKTRIGNKTRNAKKNQKKQFRNTRKKRGGGSGGKNNRRKQGGTRNNKPGGRGGGSGKNKKPNSTQSFLDRFENSIKNGGKPSGGGGSSWGGGISSSGGKAYKPMPPTAVGSKSSKPGIGGSGGRSSKTGKPGYGTAIVGAKSIKPLLGLACICPDDKLGGGQSKSGKCDCTFMPTYMPTYYPTGLPTAIVPTMSPTYGTPTMFPTMYPSGTPTFQPTLYPTVAPSGIPTDVPTDKPTDFPTLNPTLAPNGDRDIPLCTSSFELSRLTSSLPMFHCSPISNYFHGVSDDEPFTISGKKQFFV
ncbi:predicted protein [Thalassiosira pseudonana CCMP1335]|uniref:Uncharacterized protein n=1 Tax=Thalassiosira pseudonana TaxID=35128 RepID=B8BW61_THAPS|nr:predicted protein [Thalassiosira pseudonana CCMP1335]EED93974.1 predicted protein [Thalassiosira pseudonana CCMP1335]